MKCVSLTAIIAFQIMLLEASSATAAVAGSPTLFCAAELSTGIAPSGGQWRPTNFNTVAEKFTVSPNKVGGADYKVTKLGADSALHTCRRSKWPDGTVSDRLICGGMGFGMIIDIAALRYVEVYSIGYIENDQSGSNTPALTFGTCSKISE